jgi:hypothetical protein
MRRYERPKQRSGGKRELRWALLGVVWLQNRKYLSWWQVARMLARFDVEPGSVWMDAASATV